MENGPEIFHINEYYPIRFTWHKRRNLRNNRISKDFINEINKELSKKQRIY